MLPRLLILGILTVASLAVSAPDPRPNILFLLSDDQDWAGLDFPQHPDHPEGSCNPVFETPHLRALAKQGMIFTDAYAPASVCSATRFSLQTGMTTARTGWTKAAPILTAASNPKLLPPATLRNFDGAKFTTIGEVLQSAGYRTAHYGKWHINGGGPEANGYHESDGENGNEVAFRPEHKGGDNPVDITGMGRRAANFMKDAKAAGKPFFIQMSYHALHAPEHAREETIAKYAAKASSWKGRIPKGAALTEDLDRGVGQLLLDLEKLGLQSNTYVIYMSDNGAGGKGGGRGIRGGKGSIWDGGIRSPLIIRGPGVPGGSVSRTRVTGLDLFPTFCHWAGLAKEQLPKGIDGGDLSHVFSGSDNPVRRAREEIIFHFPHYQGDAPMSALYLGRHKIVHLYESGTTHLYDISKDLGEAKDLAAAHPEVVTDLKNRLDLYLEEVGALKPRPNPEHDPSKPLIRDQPGKPGSKGRDGKGGKPKKPKQR